MQGSHTFYQRMLNKAIAQADEYPGDRFAEADIHEAGAQLDASAKGRLSTTKVLEFRKSRRPRQRRNRTIA